MAEYGVFMFGVAATGLGYFGFQFFNFWRLSWVKACISCSLFGLFQIVFELTDIGCTATSQRLFYFFFKAFFQIFIDLIGTRIEDAINTKIQFGAINLENFS